MSYTQSKSAALCGEKCCNEIHYTHLNCEEGR